MSDHILMATSTYDGKDYCLEEWAKNVSNMDKPNGLEVTHQIVDNSENIKHVEKLEEFLGGVEISAFPRASNQRVQQILSDSYTFLWSIANERPLFLLESDVKPPQNALMEMWKFHLENPKVGVIGCHVGYPNKAGDDGFASGFSKYMQYRFLRDEEQQYDEVNALDAEKWDRIRPRIQENTIDGKPVERKNSKKHEFRVANQEGRLWYQGFNEHRAYREFNKALGDYQMPMKVHKLPRFPDNIIVLPDLDKPAKVEALHWGCTLIMPEVHQKIRPRFVKSEDHCPDFYFYKDCLAQGVEVWSLPIVCLHRHQMWGQEIKVL